MQVLRVQIFTIYNHRVISPPPPRNWLFIRLKQGPEDYFDPWLQNNVKYKTKNKDNEDKSNGKERRWEGGGEGKKKLRVQMTGSGQTLHGSNYLCFLYI